MGRFSSPDPSGLAYADITNPQSFNLYTYALNNPLKFVDPNGLYCAWEDGTSDDDPSDGGANHGDCDSQGGHWTDQSNPCGGADGCTSTFDWNAVQADPGGSATTSTIPYQPLGKEGIDALVKMAMLHMKRTACNGAFGAVGNSLGIPYSSTAFGNAIRANVIEEPNTNDPDGDFATSSIQCQRSCKTDPLTIMKN